MNSKTYLRLIYNEEPKELSLTTIIEKFSKFNDIGTHKELPIFEIKTNQNFPMESTLVPIMKRKLMAYVFQIVNIEKIKNFDSEI